MNTNSSKNQEGFVLVVAVVLVALIGFLAINISLPLRLVRTQ